MNMIENVGNAIAERVTCETYELDTGAFRDSVAKAAIEAVLEPTEAMIDAACYSSFPPYADESVRQIFKAMIEAALEEQKI